jgi:hypothetical protein
VDETAFFESIFSIQLSPEAFVSLVGEHVGDSV